MLFKTISFILHHPLTGKYPFKAISRYISWQLGYRLLPHPVIYPFIENSKLVVKKGMSGATGNIYTGLHDFEEMGFTLHLLRPGDLFIDIGANIGSYTVLASAVAGASSYSFEPIPSTYKHLLNNILVNGISEITVTFNEGLGDENRMLQFSNELDTVNHVLTMEEGNTSWIDVPVGTLDNKLNGLIPILIKLDVEGYEYQVLQGGRNTLQKPGLKAIIIELNGSGERYGIPDNTIHNYLLSFNFKPYDYNPFNRSLRELKTFKPNGNTIYIKDLDFAGERTQSQRKIMVNSVEF
jgi:FkbM family methyltransferase